MKRKTLFLVGTLIGFTNWVAASAQERKGLQPEAQSAEPAGSSIGAQKTYGPFELTPADVRALLASGPSRPPLLHGEEGDKFVARTQGVRRVVVTDAKIRAAAEGQPQHAQVPGPPGPPPPNPPLQTPTAIVSWEAAGMTAGDPPDPQIAASHSHVVVATQLTLGFFAKDGTLLGSTDYNSFFSKLGLDNGTVSGSEIQSDPRLIFDEYRKRFWLIHDAGNGSYKPPPQTVRGRIYVAVSKSEDPTAGWWLYWWDAVADWHVKNSPIYQTGDGADFPSIGITPADFHQTIWVDNAATKRSYSWVVIKPADQLAKGVAANGSSFTFTDPNGKLFTTHVEPAVHHGPTSLSYYVGRWSTDKLVIWALPSSPPSQTTPTPTTKPVVVTLVDGNGKSDPFSQASGGPQKGSKVSIEMENLGNEVIKAIYRNGMLYAVTNDARDWFNDGKILNSIRLVRLSVKGYPKIPTKGDPSYINRVFGMNNVFDDNVEIDHMYYGWPAVEVNKTGDMIVVYARTGSPIDPEVRFSSYYHNEPDIRPSRQLHPGEAPYTGAAKYSDGHWRWGDVAGASVDPDEDVSVWITHEYAKKVNGSPTYGIWVGKVTP